VPHRRGLKMPMNRDTNIAPVQRGSSDPLLDPLVHVPEPSRGPSQGYGYSGAYEDAGGFNIKDYWRIVRKNLWVIVTLCVLTTTIISIASYRVEDTYKASCLIQIEDPNQALA